MNEQWKNRAFRILDRLHDMAEKRPWEFDRYYAEWEECKTDKEREAWLEKMRAMLSLEAN